MKTSREYFCTDLPSRPVPEIGKVLVTGATGYIGGRLVPELLARGYNVRVLVRVGSPEHKERWPGTEIAIADARNPTQLLAALEGVNTAFYLIHSLLFGQDEFDSIDLEVAENFRQAAETCGVERIIYLCGLGADSDTLSHHLRSRMEVARTLRQGNIPITVLRAAIIIGSGSASYEIIKHLVANLRVFPLPRWAQTRCQPIGIRDVIKYLVGVLEIEETADKTFDIGGQDILTYKDMIRLFARRLGKKIIFIPSPVSSITLYGYFASLMTPVPGPITRCLMEGVKNEVVCENNAIREFLPFTPLHYDEALELAMSREDHDGITTRWSDAYPPAHDLALKFRELEKAPRFSSSYSLSTTKSRESLFKTICKIGGKSGWFHSTLLWRIRGIIDRILLGVGTSRGRRSDFHLRINDVIDFWRVEELVENEQLLLRAEMKLPGSGWLEFHIEPENGKNKLTVSAYYATERLIGKFYWYLFFPFHFYIFNDMILEIEKGAGEPHAC